MSWLQVYSLRLRCFEHAAASGRVVFVIQLQFGQQDDSRSIDLAKRSYSEFRTLWKDLLRATSGSLDDGDGRGDTMRTSRLFPSRESWSTVSRLLTGRFGNGERRDSSSTKKKTKKKKYCRCTQSSCPFERLYHLLKDFPFPRKQILQQKDANALQQRRAELEDFLVQVQRFFSGYPRSFLETAASTQRCDVLQLVAAFTGMDVHPASLSVVHNPFSSNVRPERARYFSYCASPPMSPSPTRLTDSTENTEEMRHTDERVSDNQRGDQQLGSPQLPDRQSNTSIRSSTVLSASPSLSLPPLHVKTADVMTFEASLNDVRDSILRQMGIDVQSAIALEQLSDETQWEWALFHAAEHGMYADVVTILRRGTQANCAVWNEATPLHAASGAGHKHVVQCLLAHGADVDHQGPKGMTPLMYAVNNTQLETTKVLLRAGADVNLCNLRNVSPVHLAVVNRSMAMLLLLLDHGATVDVPNTVNGRTPLHIATEEGNTEMCEVLLKYGARGSQCARVSEGKASERTREQGRWRVQEMCSQYRRDTMASVLEGSVDEGDTKEAASMEEIATSIRRKLDYIDEEKDYDTPKEAVSMVTQEGRMYAVL